MTDVVLRDWLSQAVESFRLGYSSLDERDRKLVQRIDDLSSPCQIEAMWFEPPDVQYLVVTHFSERKDLEISVDGPFATYEAVTQLAAILDLAKWDHPVESGTETRWTLQANQNFKDVIEDVCLEIVRDLGRVPFLKPPQQPIVTGKSLLTSEASFWYISGNLAKSSPQAFASEIIDGARKLGRQPVNAKPQPQPFERARLRAYGGFVFPPVWIGKAPKPTFAEKLRNWPLFSTKAYEGTYKDRLVVADQDGFLAIAEADKLKAAAILNEIMAIRLVDGEPTFALRENEVEDVRIDVEERRIVTKGVSSLSPRSSLMDEWTRGSWSYSSRNIISIDELQAWLRKSERVTEDSTLSETLRFLLEAYTHFQNSNYLEALVLSWLIIERDIYSRWDEYIDEKGVESNRKNKLENTSVWTTDVVIEQLNLAGKIAHEDYQRLIAMKAIRNKIIHRGERVSKEQSEGCLDIALRIATTEVDRIDEQPSVPREVVASTV